MSIGQKLGIGNISYKYCS